MPVKTDTLSKLLDLSILGVVWAVCMVVLGLIARVMFDLFMLGFNAW